ncbi:MAG TPA: tRNA pseudouridine(55) synthase TruB [Gammaproteobacteria bacterium]
MNKPGRQKRNVSGILLLDKPRGLGSNAALQRVKRLFNAAKAGHTGNLDPLASGMLPVCLGEATKIAAFLLDADKHYRAECRLGVTTSTGDTEGDVLTEKPVPALTPRTIEPVLDMFRGEIQQVPPMYSALKHRGQPLYKLARQGLEVERRPRPVTIKQLTLVSFKDNLLELDIRCSKGTYIRTLAEDIGMRLGCGAHLTALRRLSSTPFNEAGMVGPERLSGAAEQGYGALDALLLPPDAALSDWPEVSMNPDTALYFCRGQAVWIPRAPVGGLLRIYSHEGGPGFLGIGQVLEDGRIAPKRLIFAEK